MKEKRIAGRNIKEGERRKARNKEGKGMAMKEGRIRWKKDRKERRKELGRKEGRRRLLQ